MEEKFEPWKWSRSEIALFLMGFSKHERELIINGAKETPLDPIAIGEWIRRNNMTPLYDRWNDV